MCSVDSCYDEIKLANTQENLNGAFCRKCNDNPAKIVLQRKFPYCKDCFLVYFSHKYNSGLGKAKLLKRGDKVLVAFSGSPYSVCLIDLVFRSLTNDRKKKLKFDIEILFVDERFHVSKEQRCELYKAINNLLSSYGYAAYYTSLLPIDKETLLVKNLDLNSEVDYEVNCSLFDIKADTTRQDLLLKIRNDVLFTAAKELECNKIFTAETSDHIASSILSSLALCRGKQLPSITGMVEKRDDILLIRPLRECSKKEIVFYNLFNGLTNPNFNTTFEKDKFSSIQKLSEVFVMDLQYSFPSTVSTIVSTGNKLFSNCNGSDFSCLLCQSVLDSNCASLSALDALKFSDMVSNNSAEALESIGNIPVENSPNGELKSSFQSQDDSSSNLLNEKSLSQLLCHACSEIFKEASSLKNNGLQNKLLQTYRSIQVKSMHKEIKDFLL